MKGGIATCESGHRVGKEGGWSYIIELNPEIAEDGTIKRRRQTEGGFKTRGEAEDALAELEKSLADGTNVAASNLAVRQYLVEWVAGVNVRASTRTSYEGHIRNHIVPAIGNTRLQDLTKSQIKRMYAELSESLSDTTVHRIHGTLRKALEDAIDEHIIGRNPADRAHEGPKASDRPDHTVWSDSQVSQFLRHVRGDRLFSLWRLALMSGARRGELIGLAWTALDLKAGTVLFTKQRSRQGAKVADGPVKTGRGRRTVDIDEATVEALKEWAGAQMVERLEWGDAWEGSDDLVFTRENGSPLDPDGTSSRWNRHVRASGLERITFHEARHTHATLLLKAGVPIHVVSQRLGHSTVAFTLHQYGHVLPEQSREAATKLAAMVDATPELLSE